MQSFQLLDQILIKKLKIYKQGTYRRSDPIFRFQSNPNPQSCCKYIYIYSRLITTVRLSNKNQHPTINVMETYKKRWKGKGFGCKKKRGIREGPLSGRCLADRSSDKEKIRTSDGGLALYPPMT